MGEADSNKGRETQSGTDGVTSGPGHSSMPSSGTAPRTRAGELTNGARVAGRYVVQETIGRGGTAIVYRVIDENTATPIALKRLSAQDDGRKAFAALFEREYHTLAQLSHPSVIEVYDYGLDDGVPYYTMELLEGGDLRERSPMPWRQACTLLYDVCSSLALVHSRKLVHRDVGPRNIRCTPDGHAKLIDFGAMVPMGPCGQIVGTPPFMPPEALHRASLDGRADLFALGATLYYALTRRMAYPAREMSQLARVWASKPVPPSSLVSDVPQRLDALVMSLISLEPAVRPATAFEVMQKLASIAGIDRAERADVQAAYLTTPSLTGRASELSLIRTHLRSALDGRGGVALITGPSGVGHSRFLDACTLEAKALGLSVLRACSQEEPFATARLLVAHAQEALPRDKSYENLFRDPSKDPAALQSALTSALSATARDRPLAIMLDDAHLADAESMAAIASLATVATSQQLLLVLAVSDGAAPRAKAALDVVRSYASPIALEPLRSADTFALLASVFGDTANLALTHERVHAYSQGLPRACMELADWLVKKGIARYTAGTWSLPETLDEKALPATPAEVLRSKIAELSPLALDLAHSQALCVQRAMAPEHYASLAPEQPHSEVDRALAELLASGLLTSDGTLYRFSSPAACAAVAADMDEVAQRGRHGALAETFEAVGGSSHLIAHHLLLAGQNERGLELFLRHLETLPEGSEQSVLRDPLLSVHDVATIHRRALELAEHLGKGPRVIGELRRWLALVSVATDNDHYWKAAPAWRAQLERDAGLDIYRALDADMDKGARLGKAFEQAIARYQATPEAERAYRPDEAIRGLVHYVACSIPIGTRALDRPLLKSLPELLEPFAALSPLVDAVWNNALATVEATVDGKYLQARARWIETRDRLAKVTGNEIRYVDIIRNAVSFGIATMEASMGIATAEKWLSGLDDDPMLCVSTEYVRRIMALQRGDTEEAEAHRKRAELRAAQSKARQMFPGLTAVELSAFARARDLNGVQQMRERIQQLAATAAPWTAYMHLADGYFLQICGEHGAALEAFARCLAIATPDERDDRRTTMCWAPGSAAYIEALMALGRADEAKAFGEQTLAHWQSLGLGIGSLEIERNLALAEAKLGEHEAAAQRLDSVANRQLEIGVAGLHLGATFEARTRVAIWANDAKAVELYGRKTAREYRHGHGSPLGARYERLMEEARAHGFELLPELAELGGPLGGRRWDDAQKTAAIVERKLKDAQGAQERAQKALALMCAARQARRGHLYLHDGKALTLVASHGVAEAPPGLNELVHSYFGRELTADEVATAVLTDQVPAGTTLTLGKGGPAYEPIGISFVDDSSTVHVGVLAIELSKNTATGMSTTQLLEAVGAHLARAGDAPGVRVSLALPKTA